MVVQRLTSLAHRWLRAPLCRDQHDRMVRWHPVEFALVLLSFGYSGADAGGGEGPGAGGGPPDGACGETEIARDGRCVDAIGYLEPDERIDVDNVVSYTGAPSTDGATIRPARPADRSRVGQLPNWLEGNILDVLLANSTQIEGGEAVIFPDGTAFSVTTDGREIATSIHWLNTSAAEFTSEIVYDFYTMSEDDLVELHLAAHRTVPLAASAVDQESTARLG